MEVDLELSVGGSFRNLETSKPKIDSDLELCSSSRYEEAMTKREIQARRRQEAKKKREEKKKGTKNGGAGEGDDDKRMRLEAQQSQRRAEDRERRENEEAADLTHQKSSIDHRNHGLVEGSIHMMVPVQYAYPPGVQYVPLTFPCVVPYWTAAATGIQPVKQIPARQVCGGMSVLSEGWTNSSASVSPQDGDPQSSDAQGQYSERSVSVSSSYQKEAHREKSTSCGEKFEKDQRTTSSSISSPPKKAGERKPRPGKENEKEKEEEEGEEGATNMLEQMPCVSTTGNGPNGKTITGLLYRYTKTEVSIVCVCHGSSFTPAGFVEHAGGVDVSHPLRHITVIPSAFASSSSSP